MRYCTQCRHLTTGTPLFCDSCGRSFDVKLCPRLHPNPRRAEVCSQCGSRDLSTPQPRAATRAMFLSVFFRLLPGVLLILLSCLLALAFLHALATDQQVQDSALVLLLLVGVLWWVYSRLPHPLQHLLQRPFRRRRGGGHDRH